MDGFCRGCLNQYEEPSDLMQYTEKNRRLFVYSTGIQVKRTDVFTFQLCKGCYLNMKAGCKFKKLCRNSDKKFRCYLALKEAGEVADLNSYLKNNDDSLTFRLPMSNSGTPNVSRVKDDDNESTCTSIQNFISDIMESEEIPVTEARIIREVIEEEADVLDDSLDSHWLQDDFSIETDFKLDFSFSPFTTPNYTNDDHCYTPKRQMDEIPVFSNTTPKEERPTCNQDYAHTLPNTEEVKCTIDRNLENALQDEENENFYLNDLLVTPPLYTNVSGPPTPLITNILFGEKLEDEITKPDPNPNDSQSRLLDEFLADEHSRSVTEVSPNVVGNGQSTPERERDGAMKKEIASPSDAKYSVTNFYCKMCKKQFKNLAALKVHCSRLHKLKIKHKTRYVRKVRVCDSCGKSYLNRAEFVAHVQGHSKPATALECKHCSLKFSSEAKLRMHMTTHVGKFTAKPPKKKYVCSVCGSGSSSAANLKTHQLRHTKSYSVHCNQCGRGFYRRSDLITHMRHHTGEKPFNCGICDRSFARRDVLNRHMKCHTDERPFACKFCNTRYAKKHELKTHLEKGKACREKRLQKTTEEKATHQVSVFYAKVNGTDIKFGDLQAEFT